MEDSSSFWETDTGLAAADWAVAREIRGQSGMDRTYYAGIERGERNPSVKQLAKIAAALEVPIGALFAITEQESGVGDISPS